MRRYMLAAVLLTMGMLMSACAGIPKTGPSEFAMVPVKGGCFQMGDTFGVGRIDEKPVHEVCLDDFSIGAYEITQAQWLAVMENNPSTFKECGPDCPVENVSWIEAQEFIKRLNKKTGKSYRLPTEAEWEYTARSGGEKEMWAGTSNSAEIGNYAWFEDNSDNKTHPVGKKKPNGLGIYDMTGNVWEWCQDLNADDYYKTSPNRNPQGPSKGKSRSTRGGSYNSAIWHLRSADRGRILQTHHNDGLGFRLVLPKL